VVSKLLELLLFVISELDAYAINSAASGAFLALRVRVIGVVGDGYSFFRALASLYTVQTEQDVLWNRICGVMVGRVRYI
jgi:hypothetical protein